MHSCIVYVQHRNRFKWSLQTLIDIGMVNYLKSSSSLHFIAFAFALSLFLYVMLLLLLLNWRREKRSRGLLCTHLGLIWEIYAFFPHYLQRQHKKIESNLKEKWKHANMKKNFLHEYFCFMLELCKWNFCFVVVEKSAQWRKKEFNNNEGLCLSYAHAEKALLFTSLLAMTIIIIVIDDLDKCNLVIY